MLFTTYVHSNMVILIENEGNLCEVCVIHSCLVKKLGVVITCFIFISQKKSNSSRIN